MEIKITLNQLLTEVERLLINYDFSDYEGLSLEETRATLDRRGFEYEVTYNYSYDMTTLIIPYVRHEIIIDFPKDDNKAYVSKRVIL